MPIHLTLPPTFRDRIASAGRPQIGMWVCTGSPLVAEICAGAGLDWLLIDGEHSPIGLETTAALLRAVAPYPVTSLVRVPSGDAVVLKQLLDLGAQNVLVPMVDTAEQARAVVRAVRYPPRGVRGVGAALSRGARWNRVENYMADADRHVSLFVQIESATAVGNAAAIAAVDGIDGVFVGPSDLAASMDLLGQQTHPDVIAAVRSTFEAVRAAGKPVGVNAFDPSMARAYLDAGASFVLVGADVTLLARGSEALADTWIDEK
ncbi:HpcH/HpaI aldolase family protein [Myceligenerans xiligouense]|uniref:2,4-dihydroxyhept-2-enedioate aldolase n=1 Tax=Myceligenerans xiligouense TaxID=253184 RepID=A0A3N4ZLQ4_9MICO|nr:HpcH/HpaI aldolase/citrate lyase family protein [Myceligenerans xiligouense]RPF21845.1 2,4-dihydroxyhept-2-enedioate aldolase [Myceligenerans xiligouense]